MNHDEESVSPDVEARLARVAENEQALLASLHIILDATYLTVGPGEISEYEHIAERERYAEMAVFWYWWTANLIFNATSYEGKGDYANMLANNLALYVPGMAEIITDRWVEYEHDDSETDRIAKAELAFRRTLAHIDPRVPVPEAVGGDFVAEAVRSITELFRQHTTWT
ncbi:hypothetical protein ACFW96_15845 [Streptomyces gardneri]|uniref:hypothetical protein n=1 Tax=Streptomyces gardneri TaxID=66892 RepID=UPI0036BE068D